MAKVTSAEEHEAQFDYGQKYRAFLAHRVEQLTEHMTHGRVEGFEEYRYVTGQLNAFAEALHEFDEMRAQERRWEGDIE